MKRRTLNCVGPKVTIIALLCVAVVVSAAATAAWSDAWCTGADSVDLITPYGGNPMDGWVEWRYARTDIYATCGALFVGPMLSLCCGNGLDCPSDACQLGIMAHGYKDGCTAYDQRGYLFSDDWSISYTINGVSHSASGSDLTPTWSLSGFNATICLPCPGTYLLTGHAIGKLDGQELWQPQAPPLVVICRPPLSGTESKWNPDTNPGGENGDAIPAIGPCEDMPTVGLRNGKVYVNPCRLGPGYNGANAGLNGKYRNCLKVLDCQLQKVAYWDSQGRCHIFTLSPYTYQWACLGSPQSTDARAVAHLAKSSVGGYDPSQTAGGTGGCFGGLLQQMPTGRCPEGCSSWDVDGYRIQRCQRANCSLYYVVTAPDGSSETFEDLVVGVAMRASVCSPPDSSTGLPSCQAIDADDFGAIRTYTCSDGSVYQYVTDAGCEFSDFNWPSRDCPAHNRIQAVTAPDGTYTVVNYVPKDAAGEGNISSIVVYDHQGGAAVSTTNYSYYEATNTDPGAQAGYLQYVERGSRRITFGYDNGKVVDVKEQAHGGGTVYSHRTFDYGLSTTTVTLKAMPGRPQDADRTYVYEFYMVGGYKAELLSVKGPTDTEDTKTSFTWDGNNGNNLKTVWEAGVQTTSIDYNSANAITSITSGGLESTCKYYQSLDNRDTVYPKTYKDTQGNYTHFVRNRAALDRLLAIQVAPASGGGEPADWGSIKDPDNLYPAVSRFESFGDDDITSQATVTGGSSSGDWSSANLKDGLLGMVASVKGGTKVAREDLGNSECTNLNAYDSSELGQANFSFWTWTSPKVLTGIDLVLAHELDDPSDPTRHLREPEMVQVDAMKSENGSLVVDHNLWYRSGNPNQPHLPWQDEEWNGQSARVAHLTYPQVEGPVTAIRIIYGVRQDGDPPCHLGEVVIHGCDDLATAESLSYDSGHQFQPTCWQPENLVDGNTGYKMKVNPSNPYDATVDEGHEDLGEYDYSGPMGSSLFALANLSKWEWDTPKFVSGIDLYVGGADDYKWDDSSSSYRCFSAYRCTNAAHADFLCSEPPTAYPAKPSGLCSPKAIRVFSRNANGNYTNLVYSSDSVKWVGAYFGANRPTNVLHIPLSNLSTKGLEIVYGAPLSGKQHPHLGEVVIRGSVPYDGRPGQISKVVVPSKEAGTSDYEVSYGYLDEGKLRNWPTQITYKDSNGQPRTTSISMSESSRTVTVHDAKTGVATLEWDPLQRPFKLTPGYENKLECCRMDWSKDDNGHKTHFEYNDVNWPTKIWTDVQSTGDSTNTPLIAYDYDSFGNIVGVTTRASDTSSRETTYTYDRNDVPVTMTYPANRIGQETLAYDKQAKRTWSKDGNGNYALCSYNGLGQLVTVDYSYTGAIPPTTGGSADVSYSYDGTLLGSVSNSTGTSQFYYNEFNQLKGYSYSSSGQNYGIAYTYNNLGEKLSVKKGTPDGSGGVTSPTYEVYYEYYANGLLKKVYTPTLAIATYSYDEVGNLTGIVYGNGVTAGLEHGTGPKYELSHVTYTPTSGLPATYTFTYDGRDGVGNPSTLTDYIGTWSFDFDANNRLKSATPPAGPIPDQPAGGNYVYDWLGNRTSPPAGLNSMVFNEVDQLTHWPGMYDYYYKGDGSLEYVKRYGSTVDVAAHYQYGVDGRLSSATHGNVTDNMTWDGLGNRTSLTVAVPDPNQPGQTISKTYGFVYDVTARVPAVTEETRPDGVKVQYYRTPGGTLIASRSGTTGDPTSYYHFDAQGSTRLITGANGTVRDTYAYDPYGKVIAHYGPTTDNPYKYVGALGYYTHWQDPEIRLLQLGFRFYDSETGRFTQQDPIGDGLNWYAYAGGNPTGAVDPWGLYGEWGTFMPDDPMAQMIGRNEISKNPAQAIRTLRNIGKAGAKAGIAAVAATGVVYVASEVAVPALVAGGRTLLARIGIGAATAGGGTLINRLEQGAQEAAPEIGPCAGPAVEDGITLIGRYADLKPFMNQGYNVLDLPDWTWEQNVEWLSNAVTRDGGTLELITDPTLGSNVGSIYHAELIQLFNWGLIDSTSLPKW